MYYKFKKTDYSFGSTPKVLRVYDYGVEIYNEDFKTLELIESHSWTPQKIQDLIDSSNNIVDDQAIEYQVEYGSLGIIITKTDGVAFFNLNDREQEEEDFIWSFEDFIQFLEDFKGFVAENS